MEPVTGQRFTRDLAVRAADPAVMFVASQVLTYSYVTAPQASRRLYSALVALPIPNPLKMREIKYGEKASNAERSRLAASLFQQGLTTEAVDLFLLAGDEQGLAEAKRHALSDGRPLLLAMLARGGRQVAPEEWRACGEACFAAERWREAYRSFVAAGDEAAIARVRERIPEFEPYTPEGK